MPSVVGTASHRPLPAAARGSSWHRGHHPTSCGLPTSPALRPCPLSGPARAQAWLPGPLGGAVAKDRPRPLEALGRVGRGRTGPGHAWAPGDWPWGDGAGSPHPEPLGNAGATPTAGGSAPSSLALPLQAPLLPSPEPLACLPIGRCPQRPSVPTPSLLAMGRFVPSGLLLSPVVSPGEGQARGIAGACSGGALVLPGPGCVCVCLGGAPSPTGPKPGARNCHA